MLRNSNTTFKCVNWMSLDTKCPDNNEAIIVRKCAKFRFKIYIKVLTSVHRLHWIVIIMATDSKAKAKIAGQRAQLDQLSITLRQTDAKYLQMQERQETLTRSLLSETDPTIIVNQETERTNLIHTSMNLRFHQDELKQDMEACIEAIQETLIKNIWHKTRATR